MQFCEGHVVVILKDHPAEPIEEDEKIPKFSPSVDVRTTKQGCLPILSQDLHTQIKRQKLA